MLNRKLMGLVVIAIACACGGGQGNDDAGSQTQQDAGLQGSNDAGQEREDAGVQQGADAGVACTTMADCNGNACDNGVCRTACGSNYPGVNCASNETCDGWICRQTCSVSLECPQGTICDLGVCRSGPACGANHTCPLRNGCANSVCVAVGFLCDANTPCGDPALTCVNGACALRCGPNAPGNQCPAGLQCGANYYCE